MSMPIDDNFVPQAQQAQQAQPQEQSRSKPNDNLVFFNSPENSYFKHLMSLPSLGEKNAQNLPQDANAQPKQMTNEQAIDILREIMKMYVQRLNEFIQSHGSYKNEPEKPLYVNKIQKKEFDKHAKFQEKVLQIGKELEKISFSEGFISKDADRDKFILASKIVAKFGNLFEATVSNEKMTKKNDALREFANSLHDSIDLKLYSVKALTQDALSEFTRPKLLHR